MKLEAYGALGELSISTGFVSSVARQIWQSCSPSIKSVEVVLILLQHLNRCLTTLSPEAEGNAPSSPLRNYSHLPETFSGIRLGKNGRSVK